MAEDAIQVQKKAFIATIKDAERKEQYRLKRLAAITSKNEHAILAQRYDRERDMERERIEHLAADLETLKIKKQQGQLDVDMAERKRKQRQTAVVQHLEESKANVNRFAGIENYDQQIFHADIVKKFDRHDKKFEHKITYQPFDEYAEKRKLTLLEQKRSILKQLINVEQAASNNLQTGGGGDYNYNSGRMGGGTTRRDYDTFSTVSSGSRRSSVSYATFATKQPQNHSMPPRGNNHSRQHFIPKLALPSSR